MNLQFFGGKRMIAIKEMKMPNSCSECNLTTRRTWNYVCSINMKDIDCAETKRPKGCPLVEIGVDIGDKDECVISWMPLPKDMESEE